MQQNTINHQPCPTKLAKHINLDKKRQRPDITPYSSNTPSITPNVNKSINEKNDIKSK